MHGISMVYVWYIYSLCLVYIWFMSGIYMVYVWYINMVYVWYIWFISGIYVHGLCLPRNELTFFGTAAGRGLLFISGKLPRFLETEEENSTWPIRYIGSLRSTKPRN